ncbi:MAG: hypothetical protein ACI9P5_001333 [Saprospiraceae bacterium]|jgi:hypothetical protein|tara:strand:+ start:1128 stop:1439 length:312 start_codon:yes stop_codon:yes gene_type:complete
MVYGNRKEVNDSFEQAHIKFAWLTIAYKDGEKIGSAVPYDIQETKFKELNVVLEESDFQIIILNEKGECFEIKNRECDCGENCLTVPKLPIDSVELVYELKTL